MSTDDFPKVPATQHKVPVTKHKVSGVILVDKPKGLTSQQVVSKVKYLFKSPYHDSKKAGHTGTLDPMATGLLPICMGEATKFSHYQLDADKSYTATIKLGVKMDTGDAEGKVVNIESPPLIHQVSLDNTAKQFLGHIRQIPPMYSALKKDGKKLYEYARAGIEVERDSRPITIKELSLSMSDVADEILLRVMCTKGTYVRVLAEDIAAALGTIGHLIALRRTQVGQFNIDNAISLTALEALSQDERFLTLLSTDACIYNIPMLNVTDSQCQRLHMGQRLNIFDELSTQVKTYVETAHTDDEVFDIRLFNVNHQFVGLGQLQKNGRLQPKKMIKLPDH